MKAVGVATVTRIAVALCCCITAVPAGCGDSPNYDAVVGVQASPAHKSSGRPNIVIIIADDLGYDEVGYTGNAIVRTPNLDHLASQGMRLERAFVPTAMCSPSRAALYTGLYPHRNGLFRNHGAARDGTRSMPHYFSSLGYRVALAGKVHVGSPREFPFELIDLNPESIEGFIGAVAGSPFLLVVAQHFPHVPWVTNRTYDPQALKLPSKFVDTPETREAFGRYYASVTRGDAQLGSIMTLIDEKSPDTVVVFLSDHGPQFPFMKFSNYEAGLRVPLIVRWLGGIQSGAKSDALVSSVDVLPTLIEMAGGPVPQGLDGSSFLRVLRGFSAVHHDAVFGAHSTLGLESENVEPYGIRTVRTARFRYIRNLHPRNRQRTLITESRPLRGSLSYLLEFGVWVPPGRPAYWQSWERAAMHDERARNVVSAYWHRPAEELYDLEHDPEELVNLAGTAEQQPMLGQMRARLDAWMKAQADPGRGAG